MDLGVSCGDLLTRCPVHRYSERDRVHKVNISNAPFRGGVQAHLHCRNKKTIMIENKKQSNNQNIEYTLIRTSTLTDVIAKRNYEYG